MLKDSNAQPSPTPEADKPWENKSILVGTRTGGQGKTLISQGLANVAAAAGINFRIMSVDAVEDGATASGAKLASILEGVDQISVAPKLSAVMASGNAAAKHFDPIGVALMRGGALIDLGANVLPLIFSWARASKAGARFQPIVLVVPVTSQAQSASDAVAIITEAQQIKDYLPIEKIVVAYNEFHGEVATARGGAFDAVRELTKQSDIVTTTIGRCHSEIWANIEMSSLSFSKVAAMTADEIAEKFNEEIFPAIRGLSVFTSWRQETMRALAESVFGPAASSPKRRSSGGLKG